MRKHIKVPNMRADSRFLEQIMDIKKERIKIGKDKPNKITHSRRITLALTRHRLFPQIKQDIIRAELKDD